MIAELAIRDTVKRLVEAWNDEDWAGFSQLFTEDADYITGAGLRLSGRAHINAYLSSSLGRGPPAEKVHLKIDSVKLLTSDIALVHCSWQTVATLQPAGGYAARAGVITIVERATRDGWKVQTLHNTDRAGSTGT
jgi:uncharacterized protein (TIGR02246 family)